MEPFVRKQIALTRAQAHALKERARRERRSESDLVRQAVDRLLDADMADDVRGGATSDLVRFIRETVAAHPAEPRAPGDGRGWTRDELYDERDARWLR